MGERAIFVVRSNPVAGGEDDYNDWYTNRHLDETLSVPGIVSAQRFRIHRDQMAGREPSEFEYLAIYECDGDVAAILGEFERRRVSGELTYSAMYDTGGRPRADAPEQTTPQPTGFFYYPITDKRASADDPA